MKKIVLVATILSTLIAPNLIAGPFHLRQGNLPDGDEIDITWKQQSGICPTKFPVESMNCTYTYSNMAGLPAKYIGELDVDSSFSTENTFLLDMALNASSQTKGYPFDASSCKNLQAKVKSGSIITINKTGCVLS